MDFSQNVLRSLNKANYIRWMSFEHGDKLKNMNGQMDLTIEKPPRFLQVFGTEKTSPMKQIDSDPLDQFFSDGQVSEKQPYILLP